MSYLTYLGKYITLGGKFATGINFSEPSTGVVGWATYNPSLGYDPSYGFVQFPAHPDVSGNVAMSFKMYLEPDASRGWLFSLGDPSAAVSSGNIHARLQAVWAGRWVYMVNVGDYGWSYKQFEITWHRDRVVWCQIIKSGHTIVSMQADSSMLQVMGTGIPGAETKRHESRIGLNGPFDASSVVGSTSLPKAYIWDISIGTSHAWTGKGPNANTDAAWVDTVGSLDGSVYGWPGIKNIIGA